MSKDLKVLVLIAVVVIVASVVGLQMFKKSSQEQPSQVESVGSSTALQTEQNAGKVSDVAKPELIRSDSPSMGATMSRVTIVEFLDPECEACKAFFPIMKKALSDNQDRIYFVVRYMAFHKSSIVAISAVESAGLQGKYWEMLELLFDKAEEWGHKNVPDESLFVGYAKSLNLNTEKFKKDLSSPQWKEKIERDMADGKALGVRGTPTIFVNGRMLSDLSPEELTRRINEGFSSPN